MQAFLLILPILPYFILAIASNTCDILKPLYMSFECKRGCINRIPGTKYDCKTEYSDDLCYFNDSYYDNGIALPTKYPDFTDSEICRYTCDTTSLSVGPFFEPDDCGNATLDPEYADKCIHDVLYNNPYFNARWMPIFVDRRRCPIEWTDFVSPELVSNATCTVNTQNCCEFLDIYKFYVNTTFELNRSTNCTCNCPPLLECMQI